METNAPGDVNNRVLRAEAATLLGLPVPPVSGQTKPPVATTQSHG
jgi:hypothetical protein